MLIDCSNKAQRGLVARVSVFDAEGNRLSCVTRVDAFAGWFERYVVESEERVPGRFPLVAITLKNDADGKPLVERIESPLLVAACWGDEWRGPEEQEWSPIDCTPSLLRS